MIFLIFSCELWAKYCFPNEAWSSPKFQDALHKQHKMLCSKHFKSTCFNEKKLFRTAVPDVQCQKVSTIIILKVYLKHLSYIAQKYRHYVQCSLYYAKLFLNDIDKAWTQRLWRYMGSMRHQIGNLSRAE